MSTPGDRLRAAALRVTKQRLAVLHVLGRYPHSDAGFVVRAVREEIGAVSTQAVYDVLAVLSRAGLVRRIEPAGSPARFEDGSPTWGCTWGTDDSYADLREISAAGLAQVAGDADAIRTPLSGVGDSAVLVKWKGGTEPYVYLTVGGVDYRVDIAVNRRFYLDGANADREAAAEQALAKAVTT